ncbi:hypothetical protein WN944_005988 [Citrus x changshan-huyou]|uniref:Uncharacterized protein n=1 Tax=Citrus x changshan-huyou TaxID=2935761 RepID=A0AAP0MK84_9ROSI
MARYDLGLSLEADINSLFQQENTTKRPHGLMVVRATCNLRSTNVYCSLLRQLELYNKWLPLRPALTHLIDRRLALDFRLPSLWAGIIAFASEYQFQQSRWSPLFF